MSGKNEKQYWYERSNELVGQLNKVREVVNGFKLFGTYTERDYRSAIANINEILEEKLP